MADQTTTNDLATMNQAEKIAEIKLRVAALDHCLQNEINQHSYYISHQTWMDTVIPTKNAFISAATAVNSLIEDLEAAAAPQDQPTGNGQES